MSGPNPETLAEAVRIVTGSSFLLYKMLNDETQEQVRSIVGLVEAVKAAAVAEAVRERDAEIERLRWGWQDEQRRHTVTLQALWSWKERYCPFCEEPWSGHTERETASCRADSKAADA